MPNRAVHNPVYNPRANDAGRKIVATKKKKTAAWQAAKSCLRCGAEFMPARWTQEYCQSCRSVCSVDGCNSPLASLGMCGAHVWRLRNHGKVGVGLKRPARGVAANRNAQRPSVECVCEYCNKTFKSAYSLTYDKDGNFKRRWCSSECMYSAKDRKPTFICATCGEEKIRRKGVRNHGYDYSQKYCSPRCLHIGQTNPDGVLDKNGYRLIRIGGKSVPEHRHIMEKIIGRPLSEGENVHHKNGNRLDNSAENLELWISQQPPGQRVSDLVKNAISIFKKYPEILSDHGYQLIALESAEATALLIDESRQTAGSSAGLLSAGL